LFGHTLEAPSTARENAPADPPDPPPEPDDSRRDKSKQPASFRASIVVSPSIRSQAGGMRGRIWGDTADFVYVGYRLEVGEGWSIVPGSEHFELLLDKGSWKRVEEFEWFAAWSEARSPSGDRKAIVQAPWCDQNDSLTIRLVVTATLTDGSGPPQSCRSGPDSPRTMRRLEIVGASPSLAFTSDSSAPADGTTKVRVAPVLFLFGEPYAGGLSIVKGSERLRTLRDTGEPFDIDFYFDRSYESFDGDPNPERRVQGLILRCMFLLEDDYLVKQLTHGHCVVGFVALPTGHGPGEDSIRSELDNMAAAHYRACAAHVDARRFGKDPGGADFVLQPSYVGFTFDGKADLPTFPNLQATPDRRYATTVRGRVWAAGGDRFVRGSDIKQDLRKVSGPGLPQKIMHWDLEFHYDPPSESPMREWDPSPQGDSWLESIDDIDEEGWLTFQSAPQTDVRSIVYDHWKMWYYPAEHYLSGQCSILDLKLRADSIDVPIGKVHIDPPCKIYAYADFRGGVPAMPGHASLGIIDETGRELRVGFFPHYSILQYDPEEHAFLAGSTVTVPGVAGAVVGEKVGVAICGGAARAALIDFGVFSEGTTLASLVARGTALQLASFLPEEAAAGPPGWIIMALTVGAGIAAGMAAGVEVAKSGVGILRDDGPPTAHEFDTCRGWDISRSDYDKVRAILTEYKRRSDQNELYWELTGAIHQKYPDLRSYSGNCSTFVADVFSALGIGLVTVYDVTRPTAIGDSIATLTRLETNPEYHNATAFRHKWTYSGRAGDLSKSAELAAIAEPIDALGKWDAPAPPQSRKRPSATQH
jgi:hypothetical protein